ncbi:hypothetical protein [Nocardia barduliensis]|uniref:hypothetical protein n=1 Tax=Nocardia barduliensis TaxID=2736643 RepID=UPI0015740434|nr:hypothetical protein [Nocardia barduliensis]
MDEPVCTDCWRRDNLSFAQRLDPAFISPGPVHRCAAHLTQQQEPPGDPGRTPQAA